LLEVVAGVDGVRAADGDVNGYAQLVAPDGEPMGNPGQGAPTLGNSWPTVDELNPMRLVAGTPPLDEASVVIDRQSAQDGPFALGDPVTILLQGGPRQFTVSGIATFGSADSLLGASMAMFRTDVAQEILGTPGTFSSITVVGADGVGQAELRDRIARVLPPEVEVITGDELRKENQSAVAEALSFFDTFMLVFALIALFVAAFIIYNTFSILVAQRNRELALLRALGAARRQVLGAVLVEALAIGVLASALGLGAGVAVAAGLHRTLGALGFAIPAGSIVLGPSTIYTSVVVGVAMTLAAATLPARRASRIAPMAAMREQALDASATSLVRLTAGIAVLATGSGLLLWGLLGGPDNGVAIVGGGAALVFLGVATLGPIVARPFSDLVGRPIAALRGVPGELARENAVRHPKRTSATASALTIGVGLVGAITIFAASTKASIDKAIDESVVGDLVVDSGTFGFGGLSPELSDELAALPEVEAASGIRIAPVEVDGAARSITSVDPDTIGRIVDVGVSAGRVEDLGVSQLAVYDRFAEERGWQLGDTVELGFADTGTQTFTIAVLYTENALAGDLVIGHPAYDANVNLPFDFQIYVRIAESVDAGAARAAVEATAAPYSNAEVQDLTEYKAAQSAQIDQLLGLIYALLALAVLIALIGIANTLALSILERRRELGLLRAVGMTRRQVRASVRWESTIIALFGSLVGIAVGIFF
ncbi:MAG: ABC transporter permease, partial [Acidimicrobiia bacterium]|nr:ABC transporter permease [Acidimicrobiia bacterium]